MNEVAYRKLISGKTHGVGAILLRFGLFLLSLVFGMAARSRLLLYRLGLKRSRSTDIPVICVGNLTTGGSGKTPMVIALADHFLAKGRKVAVVSRGYRSLEGGENDETLLLREAIPDALLISNPDRYAGVQEATANGAEVAILDDGFSHIRLKRDFDLLLFDASAPFGFRHFLPRGLLREPLSSAKRADFGVITRAALLDVNASEALEERVRALGFDGSCLAKADHQPSLLVGVSNEGFSAPVESLKGKRVLALCGIANPEAFAATLSGLGAEVVSLHAEADHFHFDDAWLADHWPKLLGESVDAIVVTQKDAVKLRGRVDESRIPVFELRVEMKLAGDGFDRLCASIEEKLAGRSNG